MIRREARRRGALVTFTLMTEEPVSVVGDFNGWDPKKTPLSRSGDSGLWTVQLPLSAGRHVYSFVVDGAWNRDPSAPLAPEDGFGHANSVRIVGRGAAS